MLEQMLIKHCAPTMAGMKSASLFRLSKADPVQLEKQLEYWNGLLGTKGLYLTLLGWIKGGALVYVYRPDKLQKDLEQLGAAEFLCGYGYRNTCIDDALERLRTRIAVSGEFPHEIGLFLGYPLGDVIGFLENNGKNCRCVGCWKVYCNECQAQKLFSKFKKCRDVYQKQFHNGRSLIQLTVAA